MSAFYTIDFDMRFAPQWRTLFSKSQLPKMLRSCGALYILASTCTSHGTSVYLFNCSTSKCAPKLAKMRCFVHFDLETCFALMACNFSSLIWPDVSAPKCRPSGATNHWENTAFPTFSRAWIFFLRLFSTLLFSDLLFSDSSHLCFSSVHMIVGSLTSELPSMSDMLVCSKASSLGLTSIDQHRPTMALALHPYIDVENIGKPWVPNMI